MLEVVWMLKHIWFNFETNGVFETKKPIKEQINKYKMTEREIYEKFDNLSEDELNTKS